MKIFSVYDKKAVAYLQPFMLETEGLAIRLFADKTLEAGTPFNKHPEDYTLFRIGTFDEFDGKVTGEEPTPIGNALQYVAQADSLRIAAKN